MVITPYEASMAAEWDEFAARSRQQTFLLTRPYMDYHSDRFADASIIARSDSGRIVAMLPANRSGNILWSRSGPYLWRMDNARAWLRRLLDA